MFSLIHYISAHRRLDECERTIIMMGGSQFNDDEIPAQLAAQRQMIKHELEYYGDKVRKLIYVLLFLFGTFVFSVTILAYLKVI